VRRCGCEAVRCGAGGCEAMRRISVEGEGGSAHASYHVIGWIGPLPVHLLKIVEAVQQDACGTHVAHISEAIRQRGFHEAMHKRASKLHMCSLCISVCARKTHHLLPRVDSRLLDLDAAARLRRLRLRRHAERAELMNPTLVDSIP
jgi:hypothetical protein